MSNAEWDPADMPALEPDDRLFGPRDSDWIHNACLNFGAGEIGHVDGLRMAADLAVDYVIRTHRDQDYLVYPIVFCYRQYLELRLKGLLREACRLLDEELPPGGLMGQHRLIPLWTRLSPMLDRILGSGTEDLNLLGERVKEFEQIDPLSFAFRYATTPEGDPSLDPDVRHINLAQLREVMTKIALSLDGAATGISVYLDYRADMAPDY